MNNSSRSTVNNFDPSSLKFVPLKCAGGAAAGAAVSNAFIANAAAEEVAMETGVEMAAEAGTHFVADAAVGEACGIGPIGIILLCCGL